MLAGDLSDLIIELTEHEVYVGDSLLADSLADLRERGARIAIDDAGAGYAGLKQVMWVRPDIVKLDLELTRAIHSDPVRMALVESLVRFARRVGATVCAEGIENHDDIEVLANLDVPWGQGYAHRSPGPAVEPRLTARGRDLQGRPRQGAGLDPGGETARRSRPATAGSSTSAPASRTPGPGRTCYSALDLIAGELHADKVALSQWHPDSGAVETLAESGEQVEERVLLDRGLSGRPTGSCGARRPLR